MTRETLREHFQTLRLPTAAAVVGDSLDLAQREGRSLETFLLHLLEQELEGRGERRTLRLLKASHACPVLGVPASGQDAGELQPGAPAPAGATATRGPGGGA